VTLVKRAVWARQVNGVFNDARGGANWTFALTKNRRPFFDMARELGGRVISAPFASRFWDAPGGGVPGGGGGAGKKKDFSPKRFATIGRAGFWRLYVSEDAGRSGPVAL